MNKMHISEFFGEFQYQSPLLFTLLNCCFGQNANISSAGFYLMEESAARVGSSIETRAYDSFFHFLIALIFQNKIYSTAKYGAKVGPGESPKGIVKFYLHTCSCEF